MRNRFEQLLEEYVAGDLDASARADVEARLADDAGARARLAEIRAAHDALALLRDRPEPPARFDDAWPKIQIEIQRSGALRKPPLYLEGEGTRFYRRVAVGATLLFAVTVGLLAWTRLGGGADGGGGGATDGARSAPVADTPPTPAERGMTPFIESGRQGGIDGIEYLRMRKKLGYTATDLRVLTPGEAMPVAAEVESTGIR